MLFRYHGIMVYLGIAVSNKENIPEYTNKPVSHMPGYKRGLNILLFRLLMRCGSWVGGGPCLLPGQCPERWPPAGSACWHQLIAPTESGG